MGATQIHHVMVGVLQGAPVHTPCSHLLFVSQVDHINYIWVGIDILNRMTGCCRPAVAMLSWGPSIADPHDTP